MAEKNYYEVLDISKTASADEIKSAYRRLAKKYHPDVYATAPEAQKKEAEEKFKEIQHAYNVLSDPQKKAAYDQYGSEDGPAAGGFGGGFNPFGGGGGGFDDIFSNIFSAFTGGSGRGSSRPASGDDIELRLNLSFKEACFGVEKEVSFTRKEKCRTCGGTGAKPGSKVNTCPKCGGVGQIRVNQRTPFGVMQSTRVCDMCGGEGKIIEDKCPDCRGAGITKTKRTIKVNIPAGVDNGQVLTMKNEGNVAPVANGMNGNLIIVFAVAPHPLFTRDGVNLNMELPITVTQAVMGCTIDVPTLTTPTKLDIPAGTQYGTVIRIKGKGVKYLRKDAYGDIFVKVVIDIPKNISMFQRSKLKDLDEVLNKGTYDKIDKYNKLLKSL